MASVPNALFGKHSFHFCAISLLLFAGQLAAQSVIISGIAVTETGDPLPYISVVAKVGRKEVGAPTDLQGKYSVTVPQSDTVLMSFRSLGYHILDVKLATENKTAI